MSVYVYCAVRTSDTQANRRSLAETISLITLLHLTHSVVPLSLLSPAPEPGYCLRSAEQEKNPFETVRGLPPHLQQNDALLPELRTPPRRRVRWRRVGARSTVHAERCVLQPCTGDCIV